MKIKLTTIISMLIVFTFLLTGCEFTNSESTDNKTYVAAELVKYNLSGMSDFGFNVSMITKDKNTDIEFVSFSGTNTQGLAVKLSDDTYDNIKQLKYDGYYLRLLGFTCSTGDSYVEINGVTLKINSEETYIEFKTPIKHAVKDDSLSDIQITNYPLFISTNSYESTDYAFEYDVESNATIEDFSFNDFLLIKDAEVSVDGEVQGTLEKVLPLQVKKDSTVSIKCRLSHKDATASTDYDNIYCDSILTYKIGDVKKTLSNNLVSQGVSNELDAENAVKLISQNMK